MLIFLMPEAVRIGKDRRSLCVIPKKRKIGPRCVPKSGTLMVMMKIASIVTKIASNRFQQN